MLPLIYVALPVTPEVKVMSAYKEIVLDGPMLDLFGTKLKTDTILLKRYEFLKNDTFFT